MSGKGVERISWKLGTWRMHVHISVEQSFASHARHRNLVAWMCCFSCVAVVVDSYHATVFCCSVFLPCICLGVVCVCVFTLFLPAVMISTSGALPLVPYASVLPFSLWVSLSLSCLVVCHSLAVLQLCRRRRRRPRLMIVGRLPSTWRHRTLLLRSLYCTRKLKFATAVQAQPDIGVCVQLVPRSSIGACWN